MSAARDRSLTGSLGLLLFRPSRYATEVAPVLPTTVVVVLAWTYGMAIMADGFERRRMMGKAELFHARTWGESWLFLALVGLLAGAVFSAAGAWWFRMRLWMAEVHPLDRRLSWRVYLSVLQIFVVPSLLYRLGETLFYTTPDAAVEGASAWALALFVFPFWAVIAEHRAVKAAFPGKPLLIRVLFLWLPFLLPIFILGVVIAAT